MDTLYNSYEGESKINMKKRWKNKKGFTLVELIVVLVILAILIALLIPALTGYIDRARKKAAIAECRQVVVAGQTYLSETYASDGSLEEIPTDKYTDVIKLAEVDGTIKSSDVASGKLTMLTYETKNGYTVIYDVDWETHGRDGLYSIDEGNGSSGSGFDTSGITNQSVKDFFGSGWNGDNKDKNDVPYTYKTFTLDGVTYCMVLSTGSLETGEIKEKLSDEGIAEKSNIVCGESGGFTNTAMKEKLSKSLGLKKQIDKITFDESGKLTITYKK